MLLTVTLLFVEKCYLRISLYRIRKGDVGLPPAYQYGAGSLPTKTTTVYHMYTHSGGDTRNALVYNSDPAIGFGPVENEGDYCLDILKMTSHN